MELKWKVLTAIFLLLRVGGTMLLPLIMDCDETFNYWEPTHYLLYGRGLQTWEYAPQYALRSYAYVGLHALIGLGVGAGAGADKIAVFHRTRYVLAAACAAGEVYFLRGLALHVSGPVVALTAGGLLASAGMFHAAPSYLPSTFTMVGLLFTWGAYLRALNNGSGKGSRAAATKAVPVAGVVACAAFALIEGWPFAVVAIAPLGVHLLLTARLPSLLAAGAASAAVVCGATALIDRFFYSRWLLAPLNIILYNAFGVGGGGQGADLYGVEPASYFFKNLALNFNLLFCAAAVSPLVLAAEAGLWWRGRASPAAKAPAGVTSARSLPVLLTLLSQLWLWVAFMSAKAHKEERFMFVVYPLIPLGAAVTMDAARRGFLAFASAPAGGRRPRGAGALPAAGPPAGLVPAVNAALALILAAAAAASASRIYSLVEHYGAPFDAWTRLARYLQYDASGQAAPGVGHPSPANLAALDVSFPTPSSPALTPFTGLLAVDQPVRVCVGKEWYRFPASYFLPDATWMPATGPSSSQPLARRVEIGILKSAFNGHLPQPYIEDGEAVAVGDNSSNNNNKTRAVKGLASAWPGAATGRPGFNDANKEDPRVYTLLDSCDFLIDFQLPTPRHTQDAGYEPYFDAGVLEARSPEAGWTSLYRTRFLHAPSAAGLTRAWYVPGLSETSHAARRAWGWYHVLQRHPKRAEAVKAVVEEEAQA